MTTGTKTSAIRIAVMIGIVGAFSVLQAAQESVQKQRQERAQVPAATTQPDADEEPPLRLTLMINGQSVPVELDRPFKVEVNGRAIEGQLRAEPTRCFHAAGVAFEYPRQMAYEIDREDPDVTIWTLDGNNSVIMLMSFSRAIEVDDLLDTTSAQYGDKNVRRIKTQFNLAGSTLTGTRLIVHVANARLHQDVYMLPTKGGALALIVQDTPMKDGTSSAETTEVIALMEKTFRLENDRQ